MLQPVSAFHSLCCNTSRDGLKQSQSPAGPAVILLVPPTVFWLQKTQHETILSQNTCYLWYQGLTQSITLHISNYPWQKVTQFMLPSVIYFCVFVTRKHERWTTEAHARKQQKKAAFVIKICFQIDFMSASDGGRKKPIKQWSHRCVGML